MLMGHRRAMLQTERWQRFVLAVIVRRARGGFRGAVYLLHNEMDSSKTSCR